jgi:hypothetical protein
MDLDEKGIYKYNQRKRVISPNYVCFPNSICSAWEIVNQSENCWDNVLNYHTEFKSVADKLTYFLRFEPVMQEIYKFYFPTEYKKWMEDKTKDEWLYSDNSYPPNEIFKVMCIGFNLFLSMNKGDDFKAVCYTKSMNLDDMKKEIDKRKPVVTSFKLGNIGGHLMTVKGYTNNQVYVYDTYGCTYLKDFKEKGNAKILSYKEFKELAKPTDLENKFCICFY